MSGSVFNVAYSTTSLTPWRGSSIEYIDNGIVYTGGEESAGKVGMVLGVVASIFMPYAAPAIWGALSTSMPVLGGISAAMTSTFGAGITNIIGQAAAGALSQAATAYANGARGDEVWEAAGRGGLTAGLSSGVSQIARGLGGAASTATQAGQVAGVAPGAANAAGATAATPAMLTGLAPGTAHGAIAGGAGVGSANAALVAGSGGVSDTILRGIRGVLGNVSGQTLNRVSAALINAAVNKTSLGALDGMVEQQRRELAALQAADLNAYKQRLSQAQVILAEADRQNPEWRGRLAMGDVAGMEANQHRQAMRNIAVRQGGSLDSGQRKAYERGAALKTARDKALAYNQGHAQGTLNQNQLRSMGAQLIGPNEAGFRAWQADTELEAARVRGHQELNQSTWGGIAAGLFEQDYNRAPSPDPSSQEDDEGISGGFASMFGRGG